MPGTDVGTRDTAVNHRDMSRGYGDDWENKQLQFASPSELVIMLDHFDRDLGWYHDFQTEHQGTPGDKNKFTGASFKFQGNGIFKFQGKLINICQALQKTTNFR